MYIKHLNLVCTDSRQVIPGASYLDLGPFRVLGEPESLMRRLYHYHRGAEITSNQKLFQMYQKIQTLREDSLQSECQRCPKKVICLVSANTDRNYDWPRDICPNAKQCGDTLPDRQIEGKKESWHKWKFVLEKKCNPCAFHANCQYKRLISRMLCTGFTDKEKLFDLAEARIRETWESVDRFMAAMTCGWTEINWRPPDGKRKRRYRSGLVYPDGKVELIRDYYPYRLHTAPVPAERLRLSVPAEISTQYSQDVILNTWLLWHMMRAHVQQSRKWQRTGLGSIWIRGHHNFLLGLHINHRGNPVLSTATSRWEYNTEFYRFSDIGWNLEWSPSSVMQSLSQ